MKTSFWPAHSCSLFICRKSASVRCLHQVVRRRDSPFSLSAHLRKTTPRSTSTQTGIQPTASSSPPALSVLDFQTLLRSYLISAASCSPILLNPSLRLLSLLTHSTSPFLRHNRVFRSILKHTLYKHFCAGETPSEVKHNLVELRKRGFKGAIVAYAKEIVLDGQTTPENRTIDETGDIESWKHGVLETIRLTEREDYAALKYQRPSSQ